MSAPAIPEPVLGQIRDLQARLAEAEAERDRLLEALRPFAHWGRKYGSDVVRMLYHGDMIGPHPVRKDFARAAELIPE